MENIEKVKEELNDFFSQNVSDFVELDIDKTGIEEFEVAWGVEPD